VVKMKNPKKYQDIRNKRSRSNPIREAAKRKKSLQKMDDEFASMSEDKQKEFLDKIFGEG
tara:strand:+ start:6309 stop:6488 length:180 start_codon:yes stop_codon:yes gene_type:complete